MFLDAEIHTAYEFSNAHMRNFPFPHCYVENIFPEDFYKKLLAHLPAKNDLFPIAEKRPVRGYKERFVCCFDDESLAALQSDKAAFWTEFRDTYLRGVVGNVLINKFQPLISHRFKDRPDIELYNELLLVHDVRDYSLGPHTDSPRKVVTVLFYLPEDESHTNLGTSIYLPKEASFTCPGGPHYSHDAYTRVKTMPYKPNSAFCFLKTDNSFHGVERLVEDGYGRWLLLFDIYAKIDEGTQMTQQVADSPSPTVKFSF